MKSGEEDKKGEKENIEIKDKRQVESKERAQLRREGRKGQSTKQTRTKGGPYRRQDTKKRIKMRYNEENNDRKRSESWVRDMALALKKTKVLNCSESKTPFNYALQP